MKKIIILVTAALLFTTNINSEENKKLPVDCYAEYKVSPNTLGCKIKKGFKKLYTKKDGSANVLGKFFNAKSFADLNDKEISETADNKPKVGIMGKLKEKIRKLRKE
mgnify:CR=1 FL=1|tara:strand:- start:31 stop:351 length:321 start_codon:yes stop_codon:yes gene_type:complete